METLEDFLVIANNLGKVSKIRSDNAKEYVSKQFRDICIKNCIVQQTSAPYTASQNGTAERSFRTIGNKERCLLEESKMNKGFWPQAALYAAYLHNRTFCQRIKCTPFELVHGKRPNLAKLLRFGQPVEAYIHKKANKVSPRTKPGSFVGIDKLSSANLIYFVDENKVRPCAHAIPIEDKNGSHGTGVIGHNAEWDASAAPNTAQDIAQRAATPEIDLSQNATPTLAEPLGPPYTPHGCEADAQQMDMLGNDIDSTRSCGCPPTENLNNNLGTQHTVAKSRMNNDGYFVEDESRHNVRPKRDRHAPVRYGDPKIDYDYSPDQCFTICSLDYIYNVNKVPKTYKQAMLSDDKPKWSGAFHKEYNTLLNPGVVRCDNNRQ